ncbi:HSP20 family molecular chaperone IbpA [Bradyrhizobium japonicum]
MRSYDFSPLWRSTIGFDRLFDLAESAQRATEDNYPPYNIERLGDDRYQISLAVAGSLSRRNLGDGRAERRDDRGQQDGQD